MSPRDSEIDVDADDDEILHMRTVQPQRVAASARGVAATAHWSATAAASEILDDGGNAIDAAVAAAFALGVCEPAASGLGGQTFMLLHNAETRRTIALDGSSRAPNRAVSSEFLDSRPRFTGHAATTVPSTPAVLEYARSQFGTLPLARLLEPAIRLAEEGYAISTLQNALAERELKKLRKHSAGALMLFKGKRPYPVGARFQQPVLGKTLRRIAAHGIEDFYQGEIAKAVADDMAKNSGLLELEDLAQIPWPTERRPLATRFENLRLLTFPKPGAGPTLSQMLQYIERVPEKYRDADTPPGAIVLAEVIRRGLIDRRDFPVDPTYFEQVGDEERHSPEYADKVVEKLRKKLKFRGWSKSGSIVRADPPPGRGETTHLSVMDKHGNAVGLTQSIERVYGSFAASPELGFLYNNYISAFVLDDISHPYYLRPNAVPWASVAPTIAFRGKRPWLVIGSPGSERIVSSIMQVMLRLKRDTPFEAVDAPRLHCAVDGTVSLEASRMRSDIPTRLAEHGFTVRELDAYAFFLGCVQLVLRERDGLVGVADPRRDGAAGGPRS